MKLLPTQGIDCNCVTGSTTCKYMFAKLLSAAIAAPHPFQKWALSTLNRNRLPASEGNTIVTLEVVPTCFKVCDIQWNVVLGCWVKFGKQSLSPAAADCEANKITWVRIRLVQKVLV